jgi:protocatechuate 3,4-dioxygenase beta subunit
MKTALFLILSLSCAPAWAQTGTVTGTITDETGGALPGVTVELKGTGDPIVAVSDGEGRYAFDTVTPGTYQLSIRLVNFATVTHEDLVVTAGKTASLNDVMHLVLSAEVVVIGKRTFTNLADANNPAEDLVGIATSAGQGAITAR